MHFIFIPNQYYCIIYEVTLYFKMFDIYFIYCSALLGRLTDSQQSDEVSKWKYINNIIYDIS